jgi:hypothetical protein
MPLRGVATAAGSAGASWAAAVKEPSHWGQRTRRPVIFSGTLNWWPQARQRVPTGMMLRGLRGTERDTSGAHCRVAPPCPGMSILLPRERSFKGKVALAVTIF